MLVLRRWRRGMRLCEYIPFWFGGGGWLTCGIRYSKDEGLVYKI
jgi:hypothetical protein